MLIAHLVLASASPRRAELLRLAGIDFDIHIPDIDESVEEGESPAEHVCRLAEEKARSVVRRIGRGPVLAADTVVVVHGVILGKPADSADASRMLHLLSGRVHEVLSGVCLASKAGTPASAVGPGSVESIAYATRVAATKVEFAELSDSEIEWYVSSGEPADKAGGYAIQGLGSRFVTRIEGSYSNVVGLPIALVYDLCKKAGLTVT